jgi:hypothetical protein
MKEDKRSPCRDAAIGPAGPTRSPRKEADPPRHPAVNPRLAQQSRKILGKHYANRFGKR